MMKYFFQIIDNLDLILQKIAEVTVGFLMFYLTLGAIARKLSHPFPAVFEISSEYLLIMVVFFSLAHAYRIDLHVKIDFFEKFIPKKIHHFVNLVVPIIGFIYFYLIARQSYIRTMNAIAISKRSTSILAYPLAPAYFIVTVGCSMVCLYLLSKLIEAIMIIIKKNKI